jgi:hypothetical protein
MSTDSLLYTSLQSFPSGHSAATSASSLFLSVYLNAKQMTFADFESNSWSVFITIIPLIGASLTTGTLQLKNVYCVPSARSYSSLHVLASPLRRHHFRYHNWPDRRLLGLSQLLRLPVRFPPQSHPFHARSSPHAILIQFILRSRWFRHHRNRFIS